jgi:hypothetical protein
MVVTICSWILPAIRCKLLAPATPRSIFEHSSLTTGSELLAAANVMGTSTWRAGATSLWNASVDDIPSTYFLTTHGKTSLCKFNPNIDELLIFIKI